VVHIRLSPGEYQAIWDLCLPLNFSRYHPYTLRRLLVRSLADLLPELARRIAGWRGRELRLLHDYLRERRRPRRRHGFTAEELTVLVRAGGPLLLNARFVRPMKRTLAQHFREGHPELATKLDRLSPRQFEVLCEQVR
jgi:hypothetical protein